MPVIFLLVCWCVLAPLLRADDIRLIRGGAIWQYYKGIAEPAQPIGAWRLQDFDDSHWNSSISGFSTAAYAPEPGYLYDYGYGYRTLYTRKTFMIDQPDSLAELTLRLDYDDGFIAYLNGQEVARRGVPGVTNEPVPMQSFATYHPRGPTEEISLNTALPLLRAGENLLAIQVLGSSTNDYTVALVPELLGNFTRGPYIQNTTSNSTQIIFKTLSPAIAFIELRTDPDSIDRIPLESVGTNHVATLTGLSPDTQYEYRIGANLRNKEVVSDWHFFHTFKPSGRITFAALGDTGGGGPPQYQIAAQMRAANPDLVMHLGDVIYYAFTQYTADFRCMSLYADQMFNTPMFLTLGNHEMYGDSTSALEAFYLPTNNVTGTEHYYSFDHGEVHFAVVWSDLQAHSDYSPGSPQYNWLDRDLSATTKPWKFLFFHHVWRSTGPHSGDDYDLNGILDSTQLEQGPIALARKHGVQIVFNGHDHDYERLTPSGGVLAVVSGTGGGSFYAPRRFHPDSVQYYYKKNQFLKVTVDEQQALVQAIGIDGVVFDQMHVRRFLPERRVFPSSWNSPRIESPTLMDIGGNVSGQKFDFSGEAIGGKVGQYSSSGRLFVNNDNFNLYVGVDEAMLHTGDELFVFIETPGLTGVAEMGRFSTVGVSSNSLQTVGTLVFTNFVPSVGIILGDDFGDGGFLNFVRAGSSNNTGQGAFYLSNALPLVPGQRLTQFNRSPQDTPVNPEVNANFIKVALPYSALNLHPGDKIKVGAIVGLRNDSTNSYGVPRKLDSGIGYSVVENLGTNYLEAVEVQLEPDRDLDDDGLTDKDEQLRGTDPHNPDTDGDGMPDGWEVANGLDPLHSDAAGDADLDGMSNLAEFLAGTDPHDPSSRFRAAILRQASGYILRWTAVPGQKYTIQVRNDVEEAFQDVIDPLLPRRAQNSSESYPLEISTTARAKYYRVVIIPE